MKTLFYLAIIIYLIFAYRKKEFPFNESKTTNLPQKTINDYTLEELRSAYFRKLTAVMNLSPELIQLEKDFIELNQRIEYLVKLEYPHSVWKYHQKNVGASIILNTSIEIDILVFDGTNERRTVIIKDRKAVSFENRCDVTTDNGKLFPEEHLNKQKTTKKQEPNEIIQEFEKSDKPSNSAEDYVKIWFNRNFEYLEELAEKALKEKRNFILIPTGKYDKEQATKICEFLVEKGGYENSSVTNDGIVATIYSEQ